MSTSPRIWVDGQISSASWPLDRGLQYGDGLFETMLVREGRIRFESLHVARLQRGIERLLINVDQDALWNEARRVAQQQGSALLKLLVTRGAATARGYGPSGNERARHVLSAFPAPQATELPHEIQVVTLLNQLGENPDLAGLKHCNRLEQVLARAQLHTMGGFEGLMASSSGSVISGTMSNVFVELDGQLVTPKLNRCGIEGVMRAVVLREAAKSGIPVTVADIPRSALARISSLALSNVRLGLLPAHHLDGRKLRPNDGLQQLASRVDALND